MKVSTKRIIKIYGTWVLVWLAISAYGTFFTGYGEYGISSHLWLTISGLPMSLISWFITPHGTFVGTFVAGVFGLIQWSLVTEANARWVSWQNQKKVNTNQRGQSN